MFFYKPWVSLLVQVSLATANPSSLVTRLPGCKDPCELVKDQVELGLELVEHRGRVLLQVFPAHGVVGLLQLDPGLLDVVHQDAGLELKHWNGVTLNLSQLLLSCDVNFKSRHTYIVN